MLVFFFFYLSYNTYNNTIRKSPYHSVQHVNSQITNLSHTHIIFIILNTYLHTCIFTLGSVFLTVCINELDDDWNESKEEHSYSNNDVSDMSMKNKNIKQLYRIDIPLKMKKELKSERITMGYLTNIGE